MRRATIIVAVVALAAIGGVLGRCLRALRSAGRADGENRSRQARVLPGAGGGRGRPAARDRTAGGHRRSRGQGANSSIACSSREPWSRGRKRKWRRRIDGLTIVELDAEDGDRVKEGQVLARLDRTQLDALVAENDAATKRADAAIDQAQSMIAQAQAQVQFANSDFDRAHKLAAA